MQTHNHEKYKRPAPVTVKLVGPQGLVRVLVEHLEENFYAIRTSDYMKNMEDPAVHIYLRVVGVRND